MTQLYSIIAEIYHEMYQHVFDYEKEFQFYDDILKTNNCHTILEIGCGSGMLARRFLASGFDYPALDLYNEMLDIEEITDEGKAFTIVARKSSKKMFSTT